MTTPTHLTYAFGQDGDLSEVPDTSAEGSVNLKTGFPAAYDLAPTVNGSKSIQRSDFNNLLYRITNNLKWWQEQTHAPWLSEVASDAGYGVGAIVNYAVDGLNYISNVTTNASTPGTDTNWTKLEALDLKSIAIANNTSVDNVAFLQTGVSLTANILRDAANELNLIAWDILTTPYEITSYSSNDYAGYDVVTDQGTFEFVTPEVKALRDTNNIKGWGISGDGVSLDNVGLLAYDSWCAANNNDFDGRGLTFATTAITLTCGIYKNANFVPSSSHIGDGPTFEVNSNTGKCIHENIKVNDFTNNGARISRGSYVGAATFISRGVNEYSNNGSLIRTQTTQEYDMSSSFVINVDDASIFSASDVVWIGDGQYTIDSISGNDITLVNNGSAPTLLQGGSNTYKAGQYLTLDGNGKNGITIGDGADGWSLKIEKGSIVANGNGWFGLFHYANTQEGVQLVDGVVANDNGYIGVGLGRVNEGYARGCITKYNGNNGIDSLRTTSSFEFYGGVSRYNGVDGVFIGSNLAGEIARLRDYDCRNNKRLGFLLNSSVIAAEYLVSNINARDNDFRSFTVTGCGEGVVSKVKAGGATYGVSAYFEGRNGCEGTQNHSVNDCTFYPNLGGLDDIAGNISDYVNSTKGLLSIINTYKNTGEQITSSATLVDSLLSRSFPSQYILFTSDSTTTTAGSDIEIKVRFYRPFNTSTFDLVGNVAKFSVFTSDTMLTQSSFDAVTRTAGREITAGTEQWSALSNFGTITFNVSLSSAGARYVVVESDGFKQGINLEWT